MNLCALVSVRNVKRQHEGVGSIHTRVFKLLQSHQIQAHRTLTAMLIAGLRSTRLEFVFLCVGAGMAGSGGLCPRRRPQTPRSVGSQPASRPA